MGTNQLALFGLGLRDCSVKCLCLATFALREQDSGTGMLMKMPPCYPRTCERGGHSTAVDV